MAWLTEDEFRTLYVTESATDISPDQIAQCLEEAIDLIGDVCGDDVLNEIEAASGEPSRKVKKFCRAQGKLAYRALLLIMSSRFKDGGIMDSEIDRNDTGTTKYVPFGDLEKRRAALYADAMQSLSNYLVVDVEGDNYGSGIAFCNPPSDDDCCYG